VEAFLRMPQALLLLLLLLHTHQCHPSAWQVHQRQSVTSTSNCVIFAEGAGTIFSLNVIATDVTDATDLVTLQHQVLCTVTLQQFLYICWAVSKAGHQA
jgi:hypothetical protein